MLTEGASRLARGVAGTIGQYLPTPLNEFGTGTLIDRDTVLSTNIQRVTVEGRVRSCLVLLYVNGWQIWDITDSSDMTVVVSVRGDSATAVHFLEAAAGAKGWPELAVVSTGCQSESWMIQFYSVSEGGFSELQLRLPTHVLSMRSNAEHLFVLLAQEIHVFDMQTKQQIEDYACFPSPHPYGVCAVGPRWIAYPGVSPIAALGTVQAAEPATMASAAAEAANVLANGLWQLGQVGRRHLSSYLLSDSVAPMKNPVDASALGTAGTLVVRDPTTSRVVAHFRAHAVPIACVCFDPSGILVATASVDGHTINVFSIEAGHPEGPPAAYRHLYDLSRGITNSIIQDMCFCNWHQWFGCVTARGTVHMWKLDAADAPLSVTRRLSPSHDPIQRAPPPSTSHSLTATTRIRPTHACSTSATPPNPAEAGALSTREVLKGLSVGFGECHGADLAHGDSGTVVLVASSKGILNRFVVVPEWQQAENGARELEVAAQTVGTWALSRPKEQEGIPTPVQPASPAGAPPEDSAGDSAWLAQVEVCTFAAESLPLWADPHVKFKAYSRGESALASTIMVPWAAAAPHKGGVLSVLTDQMSSAISSLMGSEPSPVKSANKIALAPTPANSTAETAAPEEAAAASEADDDEFRSDQEGEVDQDKVFEDCQEDHAACSEDADTASLPASEADDDSKDGDAVGSQAGDEESEEERASVAVSGVKKKKKKKKR